MDLFVNLNTEVLADASMFLVHLIDRCLYLISELLESVVKGRKEDIVMRVRLEVDGLLDEVLVFRELVILLLHFVSDVSKSVLKCLTSSGWM